MLNNGFCILVLGDEATASRIKGGVHHYGDRVLKCRDFLQGDELAMLNAENNERRVIIRYIPCRVEIEQIRQLVSRFGDIESVFYMKSKEKHRLDQSQFKTASVMFFRKSAALELVEYRFDYVDGARIKFHSYHHSQKENGKKTYLQAYLFPEVFDKNPEGTSKCHSKGLSKPLNLRVKYNGALSQYATPFVEANLLQVP